MSSTSEPKIVSVSQKGQATIPKSLRERFGIETPGEVFIYEEEGRIILEPVPSPDELHGIHGGDHDSGEVLAKTRAVRDEEAEREAARAEAFRPTEQE